MEIQGAFCSFKLSLSLPLTLRSGRGWTRLPRSLRPSTRPRVWGPKGLRRYIFPASGPQTAAARAFPGAAHPSGCERGRTPCIGRRKEEKLVGGVSPAHSNPLPANPNLPRGHPKTGESSESPLGFGGGTLADCGIRSVLNPVERIAAARKSPSAGTGVALPVRSGEFASSGCKWPFASAVASLCLE